MQKRVLPPRLCKACSLVLFRSVSTTNTAWGSRFLSTKTLFLRDRDSEAEMRNDLRFLDAQTPTRNLPYAMVTQDDDDDDYGGGGDDNGNGGDLERSSTDSETSRFCCPDDQRTKIYRPMTIQEEEEDDGGGDDDDVEGRDLFDETSKRYKQNGNFRNALETKFMNADHDHYGNELPPSSSRRLGNQPIGNLPSTTGTYSGRPNYILQDFSLKADKRRGMLKQNQESNLPEVERVYRVLCKFHTHIPKLELALHDSGVFLKQSLVEKVLKRCGDAGNLAFRFFIWASKQPGYSHSFDTYKLMIKILGKMRQFDTVWALLEEMKKENPYLITPETFIILMRRFASARMVRKAIEVLDEMPKFGCEPDDHTFGCLLDALCKNGHVKEAASLFEDMKLRFPPNLKYYTCLLNGWCKAGKLMEAKFILIQMREAGFTPDIVVYNTLLSGYAVLGKLEDGLDLLREMRSKGCPPNAASYTVLIQSLCSQGKMEAAMRLFTEMSRNECVADVVTYTTLISGFCKAGKVDNAYELLQNMVEHGCHPNQSTYFHILVAHEKKEELEECLELVSKMKRTGCLPDLNICNTVIRLACKLGQVEEALSAWNEIEETGFSPGIESFTILIHGLLNHGSLIEACGYFKEMVQRGLMSAPQYGTLKELMNTLLRAEKLEMASEMWEIIKNSGANLNVFSYTIWVHALFEHGHVKEACSRCIEMLDSGFMPQPDTYAKLMRGLRKLFNREIAYVITTKVRQMAADRNMSFKSYARRGERIMIDKQKAKKEGKKERRHRPRRHSLNSL
ncbi:putative pentatricopeptide repeat-containing protein [Nymphaea thermarum]|nr:putative pentatricopeptide repeat-containing protein [Nymphaea thermarum]